MADQPRTQPSISQRVIAVLAGLFVALFVGALTSPFVGGLTLHVFEWCIQRAASDGSFLWALVGFAVSFVVPIAFVGVLEVIGEGTYHRVLKALL